MARAVFAGCARDCAGPLPQVLTNVERMADLFDESAFIFVENDSSDDTKAVLSAWCEGRARAQVIDLDGLAESCRVRTERLAQARNAYRAVVAEKFADFDYLIVLDMDEINTSPFDLAQVRAAVDFLAADASRAGVFANQSGAYYDLWALRCEGWLEGDIWEEVLDRVVAEGVADKTACKAVFGQALRHIAPDETPIAVSSAFGGLGLYRMQSVLANRRPHVGSKSKRVPTPDGERDLGWQTCEHVPFHQGFIDMGQSLYIFPALINAHTPNVYRVLNTWIIPSAFRELVFELDAAAEPG